MMHRPAHQCSRQCTQPSPHPTAVLGVCLRSCDWTGSYVCDVNGWSFVKKSTKYYEDSSVMLRALMLAATAPWMLRPEETATPPGAVRTNERGALVVAPNAFSTVAQLFDR
jgi:hypothetical protein